jgi:aerobic carbon-monoxide dehydrogenase small subunit
MTLVTLEVNGAASAFDVEPRETLADFLRDRCRLTATHLGCEHGACGACTVLVNGTATRSCLRLAVMCDGQSVQTLEGLREDWITQVLRRNFHEHHAVQCGFCTPDTQTVRSELAARSAAAPATPTSSGPSLRPPRKSRAATRAGDRRSAA